MTEVASVRKDSFLTRPRCSSVAVVCAVAVAFGYVPRVASGMSWSLTPLPKGINLRAISCPSISACTAVGSGPDGALIERLAGKGWIPQSAPGLPAQNDGHLSSVSCATTSVCTAVGYKYRPTDGSLVTVVEHWAQSRWSVQPIPESPTDPYLNQISCPTVKMCVAAGSLDYVGSNTGSNAYIEMYNGKQWSVSWVGGSAHERDAELAIGALTAVSCASPSFCIAAGQSFDRSDPRLLVAWNGRTWTTVTLPSLPTNLQIGQGFFGGGENGVSCPTVTFCAAVGTLLGDEQSWPIPAENTIELWDGHSWTSQIGPTFGDPQNGVRFETTMVSCTSSHMCTALGTTPGANGTSQLEVYHGTGNNWSAKTVTAPFETVPLALACPSQHACIGIVGHARAHANPEAPLIESMLYLRL